MRDEGLQLGAQARRERCERTCGNATTSEKIFRGDENAHRVPNGASVQSRTVTSSPRRSMLAPRTRRETP